MTEDENNTLRRIQRQLKELKYNAYRNDPYSIGYRNMTLQLVIQDVDSLLNRSEK